MQEIKALGSTRPQFGDTTDSQIKERFHIERETIQLNLLAWHSSTRLAVRWQQ